VTEAWFSILGEPLGDDETREIAAYLAGLGMNAAMPIHQGVAGGHPFLRKYALYCGGRWPLGIYDRVFAIF